MSRQDFCKKILALAEKMGCSNAQYFYHAKRKQYVETEYGSLSNQVNSYAQSLALRVEFQGKVGAATTNVFTDPEDFVSRAIANAEVYEKEDPVFFLGTQTYPEISVPLDPLAKWSLQQKIDFSLALENFAKTIDLRVQKINHTSISSSVSEHEIANSNGLFIHDERGSSHLVFGVIAEAGEEMIPGYGMLLGPDIDRWQDEVRKVVSRAASSLGAKSLPSGKYPVVFTAETFVDLFSVYAPSFSAKNVLEGKSSLAKSLQEVIAAPCFTLLDNPFNPYYPECADDEGVPAQKTTVIDCGRLTTFLHNSETAHRLHTVSTGNASYSGGQMFVQAHHWQVLPGENNFDEAALCTQMPGKGILISSVDGLHAGANPISGEFSLLASGYLYEDGKPIRPLNQFTIAGNFFTLLKNIQTIGSDLQYVLGSAFMACPSVLIRELVVAGAENE